MKVQVVQAWPRGHRTLVLDIAPGATVADALRAAGHAVQPGGVAVAVFGVLATPATVLDEGDRVELLQPLQVDPKDARRRRALKA